MKLFPLSALAFLATGCIGTAPPVETDTNQPPPGVDNDDDGYDEDEDCDDNDDAVNPGADEDCEDGEDNDCDDKVDADDSDCVVGGDTGTAYLTWTGSMVYDGSGVVVDYGLGALNLATNETVCKATVEHSGSDLGPSGCPDCDYSFATTPGADTSGGNYCDSFTTDTLFTYYSVTDFWFSSDAVKGWGFADSYTYTYAGTDYDLTQSVFMYYDDGADFHEWILRHYNFPAGGVYAVEGDMNESSWNSVLTGEYYYYFYY